MWGTESVPGIPGIPVSGQWYDNPEFNEFTGSRYSILSQERRPAGSGRERKGKFLVFWLRDDRFIDNSLLLTIEIKSFL